MRDLKIFTNKSFLDCHRFLFFRFWTWGILGTQTRRRDHKACPGEVNISGDKNSMFFSIIQNINWKMFSNTYFFFSSPMRAFEETSQQGGGGALEVAGGQQIDWQGQECETRLSQVQDHTDNFLYFRPPLVMTPQRRRKCKISENPVV